MKNGERAADAALEVRTSRKVELIGWLAGWFMRSLNRTLRVEFEDRGGLTATAPPMGAVINVVWHNRILTIAPAWRKFVGKERKVAILTSASHDGAAVAGAMAVLGFDSVRGSSSRRGVAGLIGLRRVLKAGSDVAITPDGPRGPRYEVQPGVVKLAQSTGVPLVPLHARCSSAWRLKTWDGFMIPKPFSKVKIVFGESLTVPRSLDEDGFEMWRERIGQVLRDGVDDLDYEPKKKRGS